jgi:hypothetical protein
MKTFVFLFISLIGAVSFALNVEVVKDSDKRCLSAAGITDVACATTYPGTMLNRYFSNATFESVEVTKLEDHVDSPYRTVFKTSDLGIHMEWKPKGGAVKRTMTSVSEFLLGVDSDNYNIKLYQKNDHGCEYAYNVRVANEGRGPIVCDVDSSVRTSEKCAKYVVRDPLVSKEPRCHQFVHAMLACSKNPTFCRNTIYKAQSQDEPSSTVAPGSSRSGGATR